MTVNNITINVLLINKDLTDTEFTELSVKCEGLNDNQDMVYSLNTPKHVYDAILNISDKFLSYKEYNKRKKEIENKGRFSSNMFDGIDYVRKKNKSTHISELIKYLKYLSTTILNEKTKDKRKKDKKLLIKFTSGDNIQKHALKHAYIGREQVTHFQYFVAYEIEEEISSLSSDEIKYVKRYYTYLKYDQIDGKIGFNSELYECDYLLPLYGAGGTEDDFIKSFKVIDWTQEREEFLNSLENKFRELNNNLSNFLLDLDNEKLDKLIENKNNIGLLTNGN